MNAHLLLKFQYFRNRPDGSHLVTHEEHMRVIGEQGRVWWGSNRTTISQQRADALRGQLVAQIPTYVFMYATRVPSRVHPDGILWFRARLVDLCLGKPADSNLIPAYYREEEPDELYVQLADFQAIQFPKAKTPKVPGQASIRHVGLVGDPVPENLVSLEQTGKRLCERVGARSHITTIEVSRADDSPRSAPQVTPATNIELEADLKSRVVELQEEVIQLKDQVLELRTYREYYNKILTTDYLFSSEKFLETWLQENMHRISSELAILDRQPRATWPDGKFGRMDLLAMNKETGALVIIEVKTRKRSKNSGYDQFLRYTSWAKRNMENLAKKYSAEGLKSAADLEFVIITDWVDEEMRAICKDHGITLIYLFGGLAIERAA